MPHELIHSIGTFTLRNICLFTLRPVQLLLRSVECIEAGTQCVLQCMYITAWMQDFPRMRAFTSFACLEHD